MDFRVGLWLVRPGMNSLVCEGRACHVTPKSMEVLVCLAKRQGQVVAKDEIFREVWAETFVSDDALTRCIGELRRAFHDDAREPSIIRTVPKRGYLILAPVLWDQGDATPPLPGAAATAEACAIKAETPAAGTESSLWKHRWILAGGGFILLLAILLVLNAGRIRRALLVRGGTSAIQSLAVLPLADLSGDPEQEYFADGMTEELITELAQINAWKVISRTSVMRYKGTKKLLPEIARDLAVDAIIEGTVLRSGGRVRVTAQLIDAATDLHLWSGSFERELSDVLSLQSGIARAIAAELRVTLSPQEHARLSRTRKVIPEAYDAYLKGWHFYNGDQYLKAASYFEQATSKDPSFALAHALLCEADAMVMFGQDQPLTDRALKAMQKARELDDNLAEVHTDIGDVRFYWDWDWTAGEAEFRRAVELDPGSVDAAHHYAGCLHVLGRWDEALQEYRRALRLDPVSPRMNVLLLTLFLDTHQYELAMEQFRKVIELDTNSGLAYSQAGKVFEALGRDAEAMAAYLKADSLYGKSAEQVRALENAAKTEGVRGYWKKHLEQLQERSKQTRVPPLDFASLYVRLGEKDAAMKMLEAAYRQRAPRLVWINARAVWDPLRPDPRFQSLLRRMRFPE
jgi:TolB-like protein/DNA-binding winged helix-turn-helix (wHTH) protein/Flp pilus assembly protein TadD